MSERAGEPGMVEWDHRGHSGEKAKALSAMHGYFMHDAGLRFASARYRSLGTPGAVPRVEGQKASTLPGMPTGTLLQWTMAMTCNTVGTVPAHPSTPKPRCRAVLSYSCRLVRLPAAAGGVSPCQGVRLGQGMRLHRGRNHTLPPALFGIRRPRARKYRAPQP